MTTRKEMDPDLADQGFSGPCVRCKETRMEILILGYAKESEAIELCVDCAHQLARMLLEDICVYTKHGRHGSGIF